VEVGDFMFVIADVGDQVATGAPVVLIVIAVAGLIAAVVAWRRRRVAAAVAGGVAVLAIGA
jgi:hypothetical protein